MRLLFVPTLRIAKRAKGREPQAPVFCEGPDAWGLRPAFTQDMACLAHIRPRVARSLYKDSGLGLLAEVLSSPTAFAGIACSKDEAHTGGCRGFALCRSNSFSPRPGAGAFFVAALVCLVRLCALLSLAGQNLPTCAMSLALAYEGPARALSWFALVCKAGPGSSETATTHGVREATGVRSELLA